MGLVECLAPHSLFLARARGQISTHTHTHTHALGGCDNLYQVHIVLNIFFTWTLLHWVFVFSVFTRCQVYFPWKKKCCQKLFTSVLGFVFCFSLMCEEAPGCEIFQRHSNPTFSRWCWWSLLTYGLNVQCVFPIISPNTNQFQSTQIAFFVPCACMDSMRARREGKVLPQTGREKSALIPARLRCDLLLYYFTQTYSESCGWCVWSGFRRD